MPDLSTDCFRCLFSFIVYDIEDVIKHEQYNSQTLDNDISLIQLKDEVDFTDFIRPACIPEPNTIITFGTKVLISGWGTLKAGGRQPNILQKAMVRI